MSGATSPARWASAPGETIAEVARLRGYSRQSLAAALALSEGQLRALLDGGELDDSMAERLAATLNTSQSFWRNRESAYRDSLITLRQTAENWLASMPLASMKKMGWLESERSFESKLDACLTFFGCDNVDEWLVDWQDLLDSVAFRTSSTFGQSIASTAAWLRQGERLSHRVFTRPWSVDRFMSTLPLIRSLTRERDPEKFLPALQELCGECGVVVQIVRTPEGCTASGATRFLNSSRAMIQLSSRHLSDDHFWFTFFHEAGHLILHGDRLIVEAGDQLKTADEDEANRFAEHVILGGQPPGAIASLGNNLKNIIRWSRDNDIAPGIIVGQLQHMGVVPYARLNWLKRRYRWS